MLMYFTNHKHEVLSQLLLSDHKFSCNWKVSYMRWDIEKVTEKQFTLLTKRPTIKILHFQ